MQKVFTTYRSNVESLPIGEQHVGFLKPGRYNGFRELATISGLTLSLGHDNPKTIKKNVGGYIPFGAIVTTNGSIVHESSAIELTLDTNFESSSVRYDLLVCEHEYVTIVGGQPAVYLVIKGNNVGDLPVVPNPEKQIVVGVFRLEANAYNLETGITFTPNIAPSLGDTDDGDIMTRILTSTTSRRGIIELATEAEAQAGTDGERAMTPSISKNQRGKRNVLNVAVANPLIAPGDTIPVLPFPETGDPMLNDGKVLIINRANETSSVKLLITKPPLGKTLSFDIINKSLTTGNISKLGINLEGVLPGDLFVPEDTSTTVKTNGRVSLQFDTEGNLFISGDLRSSLTELE